MDIRVTGKNISVTEGMREHLREKLPKLEHYAPRLVEAHVVLKKEKYLFWAEITILARNIRAYGDAKAKDNIFSAMDQAYLRVEKQMKRYREKLKDHHKQRGNAKKGLERALRQAEEMEVEAPEIVRAKSHTAPKPMFPEDASQQLQDSANPFLVFQNATTQKVNVIFKREDGNHGLIEPGFK